MWPFKKRKTKPTGKARITYTCVDGKVRDVGDILECNKENGMWFFKIRVTDIDLLEKQFEGFGRYSAGGIIVTIVEAYAPPFGARPPPVGCEYKVEGI